MPTLAVWSYCSGTPSTRRTGLVGPNAWNLLRVLTLVAGLSLLTAVALPRRRGGVWNALLYAALAGIPAFAVVTVPKFARDMARFGPQEPLMLGALALGGALLVLAARSLLVPRPVAGRVVALTIAASAIWLFGAYHKEASVCAIPLLAAVVFAGRGRARELEPAEHGSQGSARSGRGGRRATARPRRDRRAPDRGARRSRLRRRGGWGRRSLDRVPRTSTSGRTRRCPRTRACSCGPRSR